MRKSVIAAAVTTGVVAAAVRRGNRTPSRTVRKPAPVIPVQRIRTELEQLVEGDAELVVAEQEAQDTQILAALDQLLGRAS